MSNLVHIEAHTFGELRESCMFCRLRYIDPGVRAVHDDSERIFHLTIADPDRSHAYFTVRFCLPHLLMFTGDVTTKSLAAIRKELKNERRKQRDT